MNERVTVFASEVPLEIGEIVSALGVRITAEITRDQFDEYLAESRGPDAKWSRMGRIDRDTREWTPCQGIGPGKSFFYLAARVGE